MCEQCVSDREGLYKAIKERFTEIRDNELEEDTSEIISNILGRDANQDRGIEERIQDAYDLLDSDEFKHIKEDVLPDLDKLVDMVRRGEHPLDDAPSVYDRSDARAAHSKYMLTPSDTTMDLARFLEGVGTHEAVEMGIRHYLQFHYTDFKMVSAVLGERGFTAFSTVAEKYARTFPTDHPGVVIIDHSLHNRHHTALITAMMIEGFMMGYYSGSSATKCLMEDTHHIPHGQLSDYETEEEWVSRVDQARSELLQKLADEKRNTE